MGKNMTTEIKKWPVLLMLLGLDGKGGISSGIGGITRLQKLLFLLEQEEGLKATAEGFRFEPYKAGPYSRALYDELELLENLGLVESSPQGEATPEEAAELDALSFEDLMGDDAKTPDTMEERKYVLTEQGKRKIQEILADPAYEPFAKGIRKIKLKFANYSLQDLLYYVYRKYERDGCTSESEIRDQVLRKGSRR